MVIQTMFELAFANCIRKIHPNTIHNQWAPSIISQRTYLNYTKALPKDPAKSHTHQQEYIKAGE